MYNKFNPNERCYAVFPDKGVEIYIPWQLNFRVSARVISKAEWDRIKGLIKAEFTPKREVINFVVLYDDPDFKDAPLEVKDTFDPPIKLKVYFSRNEFEDAGGEGKLKLAYLPKGKQDWKLFTYKDHRLEEHLIHHWPEEPSDVNSWHGYFTVEISEWGDPSVSVGR